jgi:NOL1/NOP2/fmu family ribosome biogenesis protein
MAKCPECDRVFDLDVEQQAEEWYYGHDCFVEEE